jgi:hypothetical protein
MSSKSLFKTLECRVTFMSTQKHTDSWICVWVLIFKTVSFPFICIPKLCPERTIRTNIIRMATGKPVDQRRYDTDGSLIWPPKEPHIPGLVPVEGEEGEWVLDDSRDLFKGISYLGYSRIVTEYGEWCFEFVMWEDDEDADPPYWSFLWGRSYRD